MISDVSEIFRTGLDAARGEDLIITDTNRVVSYEDAAGIIEKFASALSALIQKMPNRRCGVLSPNVPEAYLTILSIFDADGCWIPVNIRNGVKENSVILNRSECSVLLFHSAVKSDVEALSRSVSCIETFVCIDGDCGFGEPLEAFLTGAKEGRSRRDDATPNTVVSMLGTGGTTGTPKLTLWTNTVWSTFITAFLENMPQKDRPVYLLAAPMTHAAGVLSMPVLTKGAKIILHDGVDPDAILNAIETHKVTHLFLPPTAIYALLDTPDVRTRDYSSLRYFIYSAAPMSASRLRSAIDVFGPVMTQGYGQAEVPLLCTYMSPEDHVQALATDQIHRFESCGKPSKHVDFRIVGDDCKDVATNELGEIQVNGPMVCPGYLNGESSRTFDGWHMTGDIARMDEDGFVYIVDRKKDMIITGGFNVYSAEVEQVVSDHPDVAQCAVIGVPDERWGEAVVAVIVCRPGVGGDEASIICHCRKILGGVKTPKRVLFRDALPLSPVGKVLKRKLRDEFWNQEERQV